MTDDLSGPYLAARQASSVAETIARARQRTQSRARRPTTPEAETSPTTPPPTVSNDLGLDDDILSKAGAAAFDIGRGIVESPYQILGGVRDAAQETLDAVASLASVLESKVPLGTVEIGGDQVVALGEGSGEALALPETREPQSVTGTLVHGVSQFLTGFLPAMRATRGLAALGKAAQISRPLVAGAIADAAVFDPQQDRLANLVEDFPVLQNPVTEFLAAKPGDSEAMGRFKNALEGLGLGAASDGFVHAVRALRGASAAKAAVRGKPPDIAAQLEAKSARVRRSDQAAFSMSETTDAHADAVLQRLTHADDLVTVDDAGVARIPVADRRAININLDRLDTPDDTQRLLDEMSKLMAPEIDEARRGVQTQEMTRQLADQIGLTPDQLLRRRRGQAFNAEQALAARRLLVASGDNVVKLARAASNPDAGDVTLFQFRRAVALHGALQEQVSGLTAEAGRSLQSFRIPAGTSEARVRGIREFLELGGGKGVTHEMAAKMAMLDTPEGVAAMARKAKDATTRDMLFEAWINGLLSGPQTHAVNVLSNAVVALWQIPERYLAGQFRKLTGGAGVEAGEATAQAFGLVQGMRDGLRVAGKVLRSGVPDEALSKMEVANQSAITAANLARRPLGKALNTVTGGSLENGGLAARAVDFLGEAIRVPGRLLLTEDAFFKTVGQRMEINAQAWRDGVSRGLKGKELAAEVQRIIADPPEHILRAAFDAGHYQTFTKSLGEGGRLMQAGANRLPGARLIVPFIRTPVNILKFVGERTPLAPLSKSIRADVAAGGARRDLALARMAMGSMVMAVAAEMTASGTITGGGPVNPALRAARRRTGWQPYSVRIGDTYYAFNRLDPLGATMGIAADIAEIMGQIDESDATALAGAGIMAVANNIVSKTYMQGIADLVEIFASVSPELGVSRGQLWLEKMAGSIVPAGIAQAERTIDPTMREVDGFVQQIRSRVPGFSSSLPPRRNLWGDPIDLQGGLGPDIISPIYKSEKIDSPADEEIIRLDVPISMPSRLMDGVELTPEEYDRYVSLAGNELKDPSTGMGAKETLDALVSGKHTMSGAYRMGTDGPMGTKATVIRQVVNGFRAAAREQVKQEFPVLREAILLSQLAQRGMTEQVQ